MPQHLCSSISICVLILAANQCSALKPVLRTTYNASNFFDEFNFRDAAYYNAINPNYEGDPTNGSVNYLSKDMAIQLGLAKIENGKVFLGVDSERIAALRGSSLTLHGRDSVRLESKEPWSWSSGIMITDVEHMPGTACGVWPSIWSYNNDEDPVGEIDLIEGMNIQDSNIVSLHTCGSCSFTNIGGLDERASCNNGGSESQSCENGNNFDGCGSTMSPGSYGPEFNKGKGGVFATWIETSALRIYWWNRDNVPSDIVSENPDPSTWGTPALQFINGGRCDVGNYFKKQTIIINTAFCGENIKQSLWDESCKASTGAQTCDDYVAQNPKAFTESYWLLNSIKLYGLLNATDSTSGSGSTRFSIQSFGVLDLQALKVFIAVVCFIFMVPVYYVSYFNLQV